MTREQHLEDALKDIFRQAALSANLGRGMASQLGDVFWRKELNEIALIAHNAVWAWDGLKVEGGENGTTGS